MGITLDPAKSFVRAIFLFKFDDLKTAVQTALTRNAEFFGEIGSYVRYDFDDIFHENVP